MRLPLSFLALAVLVSAVGCNRMADSAVSPDSRAQINAKAKTTCVNTATARLGANASAVVSGKINDYCSCVTDNGIAKLTNAQLISIGLDNKKMNDPAVHATMQHAEDSCNQQVFGK